MSSASNDRQAEARIPGVAKPDNSFSPQTSTVAREGYDYIVAGGGTAGCVLANRLSADPHVSVLLIEAGPWDRNPLYRVPIMGMHFHKWRYNNWMFRTEPEAELDNRRINWPRGRVIGGSSSMNGMIYIRGAASDYDRWASLGLPEWSYSEVLPYFRKLETASHGDDRYRGRNGPLHVSEMKSHHLLFEAFIEASQQAGLPFNPDFNGASLEGVGWYDVNIAGGQRSSTARAYLEPVRARPNLHVMTGAQVSHVTLDGQRATGVALGSGNKARAITAHREVILAGGAIGSPAMLLHSGIGAADELAALGITVHHNLPEVGRNLQDHLNVTTFYRSRERDMFFDDARADRALRMLTQALFRRTGKGAIVPHNMGAFFRSDDALGQPDMQVHFLASGLASRNVRLPFAPRAKDPYGFAGHVCHLHPESRGSLTLRSANPADAPKIRANYLSAPGDLVALRAGFRKLDSIFAQPAFDALRGDRLTPPPAVASDDELDGWIRANASTIYHPVGTCRMGADPDAVVDSRLRVKGLAGLRVVDASIMPEIVSANTHTPVIMIAERASAMILDDAAIPLRLAS